MRPRHVTPRLACLVYRVTDHGPRDPAARWEQISPRLISTRVQEAASLPRTTLQAWASGDWRRTVTEGDHRAGRVVVEPCTRPART